MTFSIMKRMGIEIMIRKKTDALYKEEKDSIRILSPGIGMFRILVNDGEDLHPGSIIGTLTILGSKIQIRLPINISGTVEMPDHNLIIFPVGYSDQIFSLIPLSNSSKSRSDHNNININKTEKNEMIIKAFISGVFYLRPSPGSEPFINTGSVIKKGSILGLIEVMKSFNQIVFSGDGIKGTGRIEKIIAKDSSEVNMGDPLFLVSFSSGGEN